MGDLPGVREQYVFTMTDGGYAKRTPIAEYRLQSRGGIGIKAMKLADEARGELVGAFIVEEGDEILSITSSGQVVRSPVDENFRPTGRSTQGVKFVSPKGQDTVAVVARAVESRGDDDVEVGDDETPEGVVDGVDEAVGEGAAEVVAGRRARPRARETHHGGVSAGENGGVGGVLSAGAWSGEPVRGLPWVPSRRWPVQHQLSRAPEPLQHPE